MENNNQFLDVLLTEYKTLREELKTKFINQLTIFGMIVSALGVSYSIIFQFNYAKDIVILIPIITISLGLRAQHYNYGVTLLNEYVKTLETRINYILYDGKNKKELKSYDKWVGWQHYWEYRNKDINKNNKIDIVKINDALPKFLIYFFIPFVVAAIDIYCYGIQNECLKYILSIFGITTKIEILIIFIIIYAVLFFGYISYTKINKTNSEKMIEEIFNSISHKNR